MHTSVIDISEVRHQEIENRCKKLLLKAGEMFLGKILLYDYADAAQMIDTSYQKLYRRIIGDIYHGANDEYGEIKVELVDLLVLI